LRDDVLDPDQVRLAGVAVEEHALQEILVHLPAVVVRLHLHRGIVAGAVQADDVDVEVCEGRGVLQDRGARLEHGPPAGAAAARRADGAPAAGYGRVPHHRYRIGVPPVTATRAPMT